MKKNLLTILRTLVFVLPLSMCFVSCEGFDLEEFFGNIIKPSEEEYVSVSKKDLLFDGQASSAKLIVNSSSEWTADATVEWVTLSPSNGVDGDELVVSVSSNHADDSRCAVVTITSGDAIAEVAIIQDAWSADEPVNSAGYYQVPEEYLDGWDNGVITRDKHYFFIKSDTATNGYIAYMNDSVNSTLGLAMYFDESFNVTKMLFAEGMLCVYRSEDTNRALVSFVDSLGTILFEEEVELSSDQTRSMPLELTRAGGVSVSQMTQGVIDAKNAYDRLGTLGDAVAGDWGSALEGLGTDLAGGLIGGIIGGLPGAVVGLLIGESFNYLRGKGDKLEEDGVKLMLGSSDVSISEIKRTGIYSYVVKVNVSNLATRRYDQILNKYIDVKVGLYIRENFQTVNHKYKTGESAMYPIDTDGTIEIPVTVDKANGLYYVAPVLLPCRQYSTGGTTDLFGYIRYGDVKKLEGDVFDIQSVEPGKCSYSSESKDYTFDVEVCASMLCPDDVSSWGIDLFVWRYQLSMDDIVSSKVGTIDYPLSSSSYTLKYEGHLPSTYLDESNDCFSLRATPFAVTNKGERVEGTPKSFTVKVSGDLCDDANHVHAVDLGLSVKWACCNVGASVPEGYGGYYAWGETEEKSDYTPLTYKYYLGDLDGDGYYYDSNEYQNIGSNISGTSYDVAHVKWGGSWRMPTLSEIKELCDKCSWEWTTVNGVSGQKVTGPNGNSIFLPAAGYRFGTEVYDRGSYGVYWSGTLGESYSNNAYGLLFHSGNHGWYYYGSRSYGRSVRPVTE